MKFNLFKKIFKKSYEIYFYTNKDKCYLSNGVIILQFDKELKSEILEAIGFAGCELEKFAIIEVGGKQKIAENNKSDNIYSYFEDENMIPAKYTEIILDGNEKSMVFDANGLIMFKADYINTAIQLTDGMNTCLNKDIKTLCFYGDKINVIVAPYMLNRKKDEYLNKEFII